MRRPAHGKSAAEHSHTTQFLGGYSGGRILAGDVRRFADGRGILRSETFGAAPLRAGNRRRDPLVRAVVLQ